jgi:hypothetical protein
LPFFCVPTVAFALSAHAQTYQWKDSSGQTVISDTPPPPTAKGRRSIGGNQPSVVSEKPAETAAEAAKPADAAEDSRGKGHGIQEAPAGSPEKADKGQGSSRPKPTSV